MLYAVVMPILLILLTLWILSGPALLALVFGYDRIVTYKDRRNDKRFVEIITSEYELD